VGCGCEILQILDPVERWSPNQALQHPFITGAPFLGKFVPPPDPVVSTVHRQTAIREAKHASQLPPQRLDLMVGSYQHPLDGQVSCLSPEEYQVTIFSRMVKAKDVL
jgi:hypothetical protein